MGWKIMYNDELYHYGVKGMKWGVRKQPEYTGTGRRSSGNSNKKMSTAKKIAIGAAVVGGTALAVYGAYKYKTFKNETSDANRSIKLGKRMVDSLYKNNLFDNQRDIKESLKPKTSPADELIAKARKISGADRSDTNLADRVRAIEKTLKSADKTSGSSPELMRRNVLLTARNNLNKAKASGDKKRIAEEQWMYDYVKKRIESAYNPSKDPYAYVDEYTKELLKKNGSKLGF